MTSEQSDKDFAPRCGCSLHRYRIIVAAGLSLLASTAAFAATSTWSATGGGSWADSSNWTGGIPNSSSATAAFGSAILAPSTVTLDGAFSVNGLTFTNTNSYTIAAGTASELKMTGSSNQIDDFLGSHTISVPLHLGNATTTHPPLLINIANAGDTLTISGNLSDEESAFGVPGSNLSKSGSGTLILSGDNSDNNGGIFTVNGGRLKLGNSKAINEINPLAVNSGIFDLGGWSPTVKSLVGNAGSIITNDGPNASVLSIRVLGTSSNFGGMIQDGSSPVGIEVGPSLLGITLSGANTYTGGTNIGFDATMSIGNPHALGSGPVHLDGFLDLNGFNLEIGALTSQLPMAHGTAQVTNSAAAAATLAVGDSTESTSNAPIKDGTGTVALTYKGTGKLTLTGSNTYSGLTTVSSGTLALAGTSTLPNTSGVTIANGGTFDVTALSGFTVSTGKNMIDDGVVNGTLTVNGTLSGSGEVSGLVTVGTGVIDPGTNAAVGTLTLQTGLMLGNGTYAARLDAMSTASDLLAVTGVFDLGGVDTLSLGLLNGPALDGVTSYTIATFDSLSGTFDSVQNLPANYEVKYNSASIVVAPVPEPSAFSLLAAAFSVSLGLARRRVWWR